jgi:hypothetical protein
MLETVYGHVYSVGFLKKGSEHVVRLQPALVVEAHSGCFLGRVFARFTRLFGLHWDK